MKTEIFYSINGLLLLILTAIICYDRVLLDKEPSNLICLSVTLLFISLKIELIKKDKDE